MKLTEFFMRRPVLFWSLMVGILIAGVLSFIRMPKLEDPAVAVKQAMVIVPYPGASAHEVELKVAQVMEDELRALPNVKKIKTECQNGSAMFTVEFQMTVLLKDLEQHFDLLRRKVNDARMKLPQDCYDPIVVDDMMDVYGIFYAFKSDGYSYPEMYKYAKLLRRELLGVKGVKRINIVGNRDEVINIILSKEKISRNGVIPAQIMMSLQNAGKTVNAGDYQNNDDKIQLRVDEAIENEDDIRNLLISTMDGKQMRLGDIATIERAYSEPQRNGFFVDGKPALAICIAMEADAIVPDVGKAVDAKLAEVMKQVPAGLETEKIFFQPDKVDEAINSFMLNLVESVVIVILVLIFTMGFRSGVIIGFGLVLTIAVSFPILLNCGTTLQRISLGAFIVAMGMLVDNAIVIMDGILIDKKRGFPPKTYLYRIGKNTAMPLLGATVIAVSTFINVFLSPDSAVENPQMMIYGLGAYDKFTLEYNIRRVRMTIVQPRIDNLSEYEVSTEELLQWATSVLSPKAKEAYSDKGTQKPGTWCQFCKVKSNCRALATLCTGAVKDPKLLTPEELAADVLPILPVVKTWLTGVEDYALAQALSGIHLPGWKIVEGRSVRKITNTEAAGAALNKAGYLNEQIYKPVELRTITDLEKLIGKKQFAALVGDYITKPAGKPTLAPESDKRKAIDPVADDFQLV